MPTFVNAKYIRMTLPNKRIFVLPDATLPAIYWQRIQLIWRPNAELFHDGAKAPRCTKRFGNCVPKTQTVLKVYNLAVISAIKWQPLICAVQVHKTSIWEGCGTASFRLSWFNDAASISECVAFSDKVIDKERTRKGCGRKQSGH